MWCHDNVRKPQQFGRDLGFPLEYIKTCACDPALRQSRGQGRFVHDLAARGVDKNSCLLHKLELGPTDELASRVEQGNMQSYEVSLAQHLLFRNELQPQLTLDGFWRANSVVIHNAHRKTAPAPRHRLPDSSHAKQS